MEDLTTLTDSPTPNARKLTKDGRVLAIIDEMVNDPNLAAALQQQRDEMRAAITHPQFVDEGTPPEMLALFAKDPFALSRWR
jgi:hypothetical protein